MTTKSTIALDELAEKCGDADLLRDDPVARAAIDGPRESVRRIVWRAEAGSGSTRATATGRERYGSAWSPEHGSTGFPGSTANRKQHRNRSNGPGGLAAARQVRFPTSQLDILDEHGFGICGGK